MWRDEGETKDINLSVDHVANFSKGAVASDEEILAGLGGGEGVEDAGAAADLDGTGSLGSLDDEGPSLISGAAAEEKDGCLGCGSLWGVVMCLRKARELDMKEALSVVRGRGFLGGPGS